MIESKQNKFYKEVSSLTSKKFIDKLNRFIVEGKKFVNDIPANVVINYYVVSQTFENNNDISIFQSRSDVIVLNNILFDEISDTVNSQGILAVCNKINVPIENIKDKNFVVILENVQDPGNLGTIIRTAESAGADFIILSKGCASLYNSKTIRSTASAIFNIEIAESVEISDIIKNIKSEKILMLGTHLDATDYYYNVNLKQKVGIVIGNEGNGLSSYFSSQCDKLIKIPMIGKSESLNAAVAAGIILYDVVRQRKS